jgi:hypothetical protein
MARTSLGDPLFEETEKNFNKRKAPLLALALFSALGGPIMLLSLLVLVPPSNLPGLPEILLVLLFIAVGISVYAIASAHNRFGLYSAGISLTKRKFTTGIRFRNRQYQVPYSDLTLIERRGSLIGSLPPWAQTWHFLFELRNGDRWALPAIGVWEAISPVLKSPKPHHLKEFRLAYEALSWAAEQLNTPENREKRMRHEEVRLDVEAFRRHLAKTLGEEPTVSATPLRGQST